MLKAISLMMAGITLINPAAVNAAEVSKEVEDHYKLMAVVEAVGVPVHYQSEICSIKPDWYGAYKVDGGELVLCKKGTTEERLNTIRHESWHVYQDLKDCSIKDRGGLATAFGSGSTPKVFKELAAKHYSKENVPTEAEAQWAADTFDAISIASLIYQQATECGMKFKF